MDCSYADPKSGGTRCTGSSLPRRIGRRHRRFSSFRLRSEAPHDVRGSHRNRGARLDGRNLRSEVREESVGDILSESDGALDKYSYQHQSKFQK